jgi:hypothetical protein
VAAPFRPVSVANTWNVMGTQSRRRSTDRRCHLNVALNILEYAITGRAEHPLIYSPGFSSLSN